MKIFALLISLIITGSSIGQNLNNIWYFGDGNFLDFNANMNTPVLSANGAEIATPTSTYCQEGASTMCDAAGNLLFYNNNENVFDRTYTLMPNGTGLIGSASTSAQTLAVPNPANNSIYYIFHMDYAANGLGLYYSEVDMSLNGGFGDVTANKNIALPTGACSEQLKAITHCNGTDIWVLSHSQTGNTFNAFLVTAAGVSATPVTTSIGNNFANAFSGMSYMTCSKDGSRVAIAGDIGGVPAAEVFSFDKLNGTLCNPDYLPIPGAFSSYGVEFSADGTKLYVTGIFLHQYDFNTSNWYTFPPVELGAAIMRGPNDKLYIVAGCDWYDQQAQQMFYARDIHVVDDPNNAGAAANLLQNVYVTPRECGLGLSTCYYPTQSNNTCAPLSAVFNTSSNSICEGDCITFTDASTGAGITSYDWTFAGGTPSTFSGSTPPQVCYAQQGTYTATLQITDCSGFTSSFDLDIVVNDCSGPQPDFTADQTVICSNDCINFTDLSIGTNVNVWNWQFPGAVTTNSSDQNPTNICYATPGSYDVILTVTDDLGTNILTLPNYITVESCIPPIADFDAPATICAGECINLTDLSQNNPTQWNWNIGGGTPSNSSDQSPQNVCFLTPGIYTIELTTSNAFGADLAQKTIEVLQAPNAGNNVTIAWCETEIAQDLTLLLDPSVQLNGQWENPQNIPGLNGSIFSPQLSGVGVFEIQYILNNGNCSDTAFFEITVEAMPYAGEDGMLTICDNEGLVDLFSGIIGTPDINGVWTPSLTSGGSLLDPQVDPEGIYTYTLPPTVACMSDSSKVNVEVTYVFDISIVPVENLCSNAEAFQLEANIGGGNWSGPGIVNPNSGLFDPGIASSGSHTIVYNVSIQNCESSTSTTINIDDVPQVDLGNDLTHCINDPLILQVETSAANSIEWFDGSTSFALNVDLTNKFPGELIPISVEVENECGTNADIISIELMDCDVHVYIPNSFTPDGDEHNQTFIPVVSGELVKDYSLLIFNRWGELVFESNDLLHGWDGTYNGKLAETGSYIWKIQYTNASIEQSYREELTGHFSLLR